MCTFRNCIWPQKPLCPFHTRVTELQATVHEQTALNAMLYRTTASDTQKTAENQLRSLDFLGCNKANVQTLRAKNLLSTLDPEKLFGLHDWKAVEDSPNIFALVSPPLAPALSDLDKIPPLSKKPRKRKTPAGGAKETKSLTEVKSSKASQGQESRETKIVRQRHFNNDGSSILKEEETSRTSIQTASFELSHSLELAHETVESRKTLQHVNSVLDELKDADASVKRHFGYFAHKAIYDPDNFSDYVTYYRLDLPLSDFRRMLKKQALCLSTGFRTSPVIVSTVVEIKNILTASFAQDLAGYVSFTDSVFPALQQFIESFYCRPWKAFSTLIAPASQLKQALDALPPLSSDVPDFRNLAMSVGGFWLVPFEATYVVMKEWKEARGRFACYPTNFLIGLNELRSTLTMLVDLVLLGFSADLEKIWMRTAIAWRLACFLAPQKNRLRKFAEAPKINKIEVVSYMPFPLGTLWVPRALELEQDLRSDSGETKITTEEKAGIGRIVLCTISFGKKKELLQIALPVRILYASGQFPALLDKMFRRHAKEDLTGIWKQRAPIAYSGESLRVHSSFLKEPEFGGVVQRLKQLGDAVDVYAYNGQF